MCILLLFTVVNQSLCQHGPAAAADECVPGPPLEEEAEEEGRKCLDVIKRSCGMNY